MASAGNRAGLSVRTNDKRNQPRRETRMFNYQLAQVIHQERQNEIERRMLHREAVRAPARRRSIRQRFGRGLIHIGYAIASDGARGTRIVRDPCGPIGELAARR